MVIDRDRGKPPFTTEKGEIAGLSCVAVKDCTGNPFCYVIPGDCVGGDLAAAKARAQRIAEALGK